MRRKNYFITEQQEEALTNIKDRTGMTISEIIRRAIDFYLKFGVDWKIPDEKERPADE